MDQKTRYIEQVNTVTEVYIVRCSLTGECLYIYARTRPDRSWWRFDMRAARSMHYGYDPVWHGRQLPPAEKGLVIWGTIGALQATDALRSVRAVGPMDELLTAAGVNHVS